MATWLYQTSDRKYSINDYRLEIWEDERWRWPVRPKGFIGIRRPPKRGDMVIFYHADVGFLGWGVVLEWTQGVNSEDHALQFRPVAPNDHLKMDPWRDAPARKLADQIREGDGRNWPKQKTLIPMGEGLSRRVARGIAAWVAGRKHRRLTPCKAALREGVAALQNRAK